LRPFAAKGVRSTASCPEAVLKDPLVCRGVKRIVTNLRAVLKDPSPRWSQGSGDRLWCRALGPLATNGAKSALPGPKAVLRDP